MENDIFSALVPLYNYWQTYIEFLTQIKIFSLFWWDAFVLLGQGLTSVHCPLVCTISMTQGSDLFSVSRSSRALQDTRSSTLETQVAGPLRLVAGEVASWTSFILVESTTGCQPAEQCSVRRVAARLRGSAATFQPFKGDLWKDVACSHGAGSSNLAQRRKDNPVEPRETKPSPRCKSCLSDLPRPLLKESHLGA